MDPGHGAGGVLDVSHDFCLMYSGVSPSPCSACLELVTLSMQNIGLPELWHTCHQLLFKLLTPCATLCVGITATQ